MRCRHKKTVILNVGNMWTSDRLVHEWCYECGAIRRLIETEAYRYEPRTMWLRPVGAGDKSPVWRYLKKEE